MNVVDPALRLSAQRALLGAIHPQVRLIKVTRDGSTIRLTVLTSEPLSESAREAISIAATEIVADFPDCQIHEHVAITRDPLPVEDILVEGWIYKRADSKRIGQDRLDAWHDGSAICLIAVGSHGDPLDLGEGEVEALIEKLQRLLNEEKT